MNLERVMIYRSKF